ncbi:MAG: hypothetical protein QOK39_291 [Acidimicrobiaceae bacterium]|nr:hypothetical protein [Acidimicrobiaceae bacterium]
MGPKLARLALAVVMGSTMLAASITLMAAPAAADPATDVVAMVNGLRTNVPPLAVDPGLTAVAQQWAAHMATTGSLVHNPSLSTQAPTGWTKMGENIGSGYSLTAVFNALEASPDHYANMVDPAYNRTGVGVATDSNGQVWLAEDFGAYPPPSPADMTFPTNGTLIFPSAQSFTWGHAPDGVYYCITVGTTKGGVDLVNSGLLQGSQLSYPVPALPGGQLWARIYTYVPGLWMYTDVSFSVTGAATATLTRPTNGATNVDTTQPFTWSPVGGASYYGLTVGTTKGGTDLVSTGPLASPQTSYQVPALPGGKVLWARMYSFIAGSWNHYVDISFTAAAR